MDDRQPPPGGTDDDRFDETVGRREQRKVRARRDEERSIWFWLGMMGVAGWSVAIPTLLGALVGVWLDRRLPGRISWTLTGLLVGVAVGCLTAWYWVKRESEDEL
ncbi:MAG: ATPase F0F1 [Planctomycetes bacterium]|nr:ATPase F0F1 [Planctomycetota bacterium]